MFQPNYFDRLAFCVSVPCIGEMPFPSGRPARYGNVRPTDYRDTLEHLLAIQAWERILRKPSVGIVPMGFSSNIIDNATHDRASSIQHWKIYQGSAGPAAFIRRSRLLSGGFNSFISNT